MLIGEAVVAAANGTRSDTFHGPSQLKMPLRSDQFNRNRSSERDLIGAHQASFGEGAAQVVQGRPASQLGGVIAKGCEVPT